MACFAFVRLLDYACSLAYAAQETLLQEPNCSDYALEAHNRGISRIANLEKLTKLRSLDLSFNNIEAIEGLSYNRDLRELKLYNNRITSILNLDQ